MLISLREYKVVTTSLTVLLVIVVLIALAEKGPPSIAIYRGASPYNTGSIGTYNLYTMIRNRYPYTSIIKLYSELEKLFSKPNRCLFISISPEKPYSLNDAATILSALDRCSYPAIIVADERNTSNVFLKSIGSSIEVIGNVIQDSKGSIYPLAIFTLTPISNINKTYIFRLDIASGIAINNSNAKVIGYISESMQNISSIVAAYEEVDRFNKTFRVVVIGDGSIFLNQVIRGYSNVVESDVLSSYNPYREFAMDLIDVLCGYDLSCVVFIDGTRYLEIPLESIQLSQHSEIILYTDILNIVVAYILKVIHPSTWLPLALSSIDMFFGSISSSFIASMLVSSIGLSLIYLYISSRFSPIKDYRLAEVNEVEYFITADIRNAIVRRSISLDRNDYVKLFSIVDTVVRSLYGCSLCSSEAIEYIAKALNSYRDSKRFVDRMCRLYRKASKGGFLPIVLSWHRATSKAIRECENVLRALGISLMEEKGFEYKLLTI
uniref:DUF4350 domain-containing protein n=2 Tax=Ignisphaera aggregans TaxID=334771 RepID=A0A7C5YTP8_9CREN